MEHYTKLCIRTMARIRRARRKLDLQINGPPAMRTRSRTGTTKSAPVERPKPIIAETGILTKKTSTRRQVVASGKKLCRKRLQLKRVLEKKKTGMDKERGDWSFGIRERIRLLTDVGPAGQLGRRFLVPVQRGVKSPEQMRVQAEKKKARRSPLEKTW